MSLPANRESSEKQAAKAAVAIKKPEKARRNINRRILHLRSHGTHRLMRVSSLLIDNDPAFPRRLNVRMMRFIFLRSMFTFSKMLCSVNHLPKRMP